MFKEQDQAKTDNMEANITRNVQREIILNKGLTRKRPKKDRNPRVKKRLKFEEMQKKRSTTVKEYKGGDRKLYKGEASGIKTGLVQGIKM
jgi:U3 small nucleolar RNA-associated protein 3